MGLGLPVVWEPSEMSLLVLLRGGKVAHVQENSLRCQGLTGYGLQDSGTLELAIPCYAHRTLTIVLKKTGYRGKATWEDFWKCEHSGAKAMTVPA